MTSTAIDLAALESALVAMRVSRVGTATLKGGWQLGHPDPQTVAWPYAELEAELAQDRAEARATVTETVHAGSRADALALAASIASALLTASYKAAVLRIVGHRLISGPRAVRRVTGSTAELVWDVALVWGP